MYRANQGMSEIGVNLSAIREVFQLLFNNVVDFSDLLFFDVGTAGALVFFHKNLVDHSRMDLCCWDNRNHLARPKDKSLASSRKQEITIPKWCLGGEEVATMDHNWRHERSASSSVSKLVLRSGSESFSRLKMAIRLMLSTGIGYAKHSSIPGFELGQGSLEVRAHFSKISPLFPSMVLESWRNWAFEQSIRKIITKTHLFEDFMEFVDLFISLITASFHYHAPRRIWDRENEGLGFGYRG
ncbi:hypothetical protein Tco_0525964 [Tanacetum coccineum]